MTAAIAEVPKVKTPTPMAPTLYPPSPSTVYEIPVDLIVRSETNRQPKLNDDFIESIRRGVDSPVLVRPIKATREQVAALKEEWHRIDSSDVFVGQTILKLVYGERRWAASKEAGKNTIPAIVRELTDTQALEIQVEENEQRKDYNIMDRAAAYAHLRAQYMKDHHGEKGFTEEKCMDLIAQTCKNDKIKGRTVQQIIALQKLSRECQEALRKGELEQTHAYELCRRTPEEQLVLLQWLRRETLHGQGDIPSTRRLKREITEMDRIAEEQRRQEKLFKDGEKEDEGGASAKLSFDGKTIDLLPGPLSVSVRTALYKFYPGLSITTAYFLKDGRIQLSIGSNGKPFYHTVEQVQKLLSGKISIEALSAETSTPIRPTQALAPKEPDWPLQEDKPLSKKQLDNIARANAKAEEQVQKQIQENLKARAAARRNSRIEKQYGVLLFIALAKKAHVCARLLRHIIPGMLLEMWEQGNNAIPLEAFAPEVMGWPTPKDSAYSYAEVKQFSEKHTRKFSGNLLSALVITQQVGTLKAEQLAKYFNIDPKKLRQKASAAVKEEEAKALLPRELKTKHEKQLFAIVKGTSPSWNKLRRTGGSDADLRKALCELLPNDGGIGSTELGNVHGKNGNDMPRVWYDSFHPGKKPPSLQGLDLVAAVRELLNIPQKGEA